MSFTPDFKPYSGIGKLRFWCQKVLPLVYDDSLSYYELLNKIVLFLNETIEDVGNVEDNLTALRDAFTELEQYVEDQIGTVAPIVEEVIDEMVESGQFGDILVDAIAGIIAEEYDPEEHYEPKDYVLHDGDLYRCNNSTTGAWDSTKWEQTAVCDDLADINRALSVLTNNLKTYLIFESGGISTVTGENVESTVRIRTKNFIAPFFKIELPENYYVTYVFDYDSLGNSVNVEWHNYNTGRVLEKNITNNPNGYIHRLVIAKEPEEAIDVSDIGTNYEYYCKSDSIDSGMIKAISDINTDTMSLLILEDGAINTITAENEENANRVRTKNFIAPFFKIEVPEGYYVTYVFNYDNLGNYIDEQWYSYNTGRNIEIDITNNPNGYIHRLVFCKEPEDEIHASEIVPNYICKSDSIDAGWRSAIKNIKTEYLYDIILENGGIDTVTGENISTANRIRTKDFISPFFKIELPENFFIMYVYKYDIYGNYVGVDFHDYNTGRVVELNITNNPNGYIHRLAISKNPESAIDISDLGTDYKYTCKSDSIDAGWRKKISDLTASLSSLSSLVNNFITKTKLYLLFESGGINTTNGQNAENANRARTKYFVAPFFRIELPENFYVTYVFNYDHDGTFIGTEWHDYNSGRIIEKTPANNQNGYIHRLVISKNPEGAISPSDFDTNYTYYCNTDTTHT